VCSCDARASSSFAAFRIRGRLVSVALHTDEGDETSLWEPSVCPVFRRYKSHLHCLRLIPRPLKNHNNSGRSCNIFSITRSLYNRLLVECFDSGTTILRNHSVKAEYRQKVTTMAQQYSSYMSPGIGVCSAETQWRLRRRILTLRLASNDAVRLLSQL
jgi:hypothetical protein